jgi:hypothetical protein
MAAQKPVGVVVLAVLDFVGAGILALVALGLGVGLSIIGGMMHRPGMGASMAAIGALGGLVVLILAACFALVGWGLWTLRNWARVVTIVLAALGLLGSISSFFYIGAGIHVSGIFWIWPVIRVAVNGVIIGYLLQPEVKQAFGGSSF